MINYIFEMLAFIAAIVMYGRGEITAMVYWLATACILGICAVIAEINHKNIKRSGNSNYRAYYQKDKEETK